MPSWCTSGHQVSTSHPRARQGRSWHPAVGRQVIPKARIPVGMKAEVVAVDPHVTVLVDAVKHHRDMRGGILLWHGERLAVPPDAAGQVATAPSARVVLAEWALDAPVMREINAAPGAVVVGGRLSARYVLLDKGPTRIERLVVLRSCHASSCAQGRKPGGGGPRRAFRRRAPMRYEPGALPPSAPLREGDGPWRECASRRPYRARAACVQPVRSTVWRFHEARRSKASWAARAPSPGNPTGTATISRRSSGAPGSQGGPVRRHREMGRRPSHSSARGGGTQHVAATA